MNVASVTTTEWAVRQTAKIGHVRGSRWPASPACTCVSVRRIGIARPRRLPGVRRRLPRHVRRRVRRGYVLPALAHTEPGYVNDVLAAAVGGTSAGDIGAMQTLFDLIGRGLPGRRPAVRHRAVPRPRPGPLGRRAARPRHRSATLATAVLPRVVRRPFAVPTGVALIGLGVSLWRDQRQDRRRRRRRPGPRPRRCHRPSGDAAPTSSG